MDPWYKVDHSCHIREVLMVVEKLREINPPSDRVPGQVRLAIPILESQRRWNSGENRVMEGLLRVFVAGDKYRPKEGTGGGPTPPGGSLAQPPLGPCQEATWEGVGPLRLPSSFWTLLMR